MAFSTGENVVIIDAQGGRAENDGLIVSITATGTIIGFSNSGNLIPPGNGALTFLSTFPLLQGLDLCIKNPIFGGIGSTSLSVEVLGDDCDNVSMVVWLENTYHSQAIHVAN